MEGAQKMSTVIRSEISKNSPYYISKHRYYELKHFCLQYYEWKKEYDRISFLPPMRRSEIRSTDPSDPTSRLASIRATYSENMKLVKDVCHDADAEIEKWLFQAVTEGKSYETINASSRIPCGKNYFYDRYRRVFWLLDRRR